MFIYKDTHLGILIWVIYVTHNYTQALDHSLPDHVRLILSKHLLQHGQHQGAANLLLQRQTVTAKKKKKFKNLKKKDRLRIHSGHIL